MAKPLATGGRTIHTGHSRRLDDLCITSAFPRERRHSEHRGISPLIRHDLGFSKTESRFPTKGTCLAIYSRCVNAETPIEQVLGASFPWCSGWTDELKELFAGYVEAKPGAITVNDDPDEYKILKLRRRYSNSALSSANFDGQEWMMQQLSCCCAEEGGSRIPDKARPRKSICVCLRDLRWDSRGVA